MNLCINSKFPFIFVWGFYYDSCTFIILPVLAKKDTQSLSLVTARINEIYMSLTVVCQMISTEMRTDLMNSYLAKKQTASRTYIT